MSHEKNGVFFVSRTLSHRTTTFILTYKSLSECSFSVVSFPDSVQYLSSCNTAKYMAIHFSHTITVVITVLSTYMRYPSKEQTSQNLDQLSGPIRRSLSSFSLTSILR